MAVLRLKRFTKGMSGNMSRISVVSVMGWSGSGKTTVVENLIPCLRAKGLRVGALKHDGHSFDIDDRRKDSGRFTAAGAEVTAISCSTHAAIMENRPLELSELLARICDVDIILIEGWKGSDLPKIEVHRLGSGKSRYADSKDLIALVTDAEGLCEEIPVFGLDKYREISEFIYGAYSCGKLDFVLS